MTLIFLDEEKDEMVVVDKNAGTFRVLHALKGDQEIVPEQEEPKAKKSGGGPAKVVAGKKRFLSQQEGEALVATAKELGAEAAAKQFGVSTATVYNWTAKLKRGEKKVEKDAEAIPELKNSNHLPDNVFRFRCQYGHVTRSTKDKDTIKCGMPHCEAEADRLYPDDE